MDVVSKATAQNSSKRKKKQSSSAKRKFCTTQPHNHTEKRRTELTSLIQGFLGLEVMTQKEAWQLRGRLQFAQAQFFGGLGRRCLDEITRHAYSGRLKLSVAAKERLEEFRKFLSSAQPRLVLVGLKLFVEKNQLLPLKLTLRQKPLQVQE